jgi:hypothetical protein
MATATQRLKESSLGSWERLVNEAGEGMQSSTLLEYRT